MKRAAAWVVTVSLAASVNWARAVEPSTSTAAVQEAAPSKALPNAPRHDLWEIGKQLSRRQFIDLTHAFGPGIPRWKGYPDEKRKLYYDYGKQGFRVERYNFVGPWGTHVDSPAQFHSDLRTLDKIPASEMVAPLVVVDLSSRVLDNPDLSVKIQDLLDWEKKYGKIPERAFVAFRSGWNQYWPVREAMENRDESGLRHYPGWSVEAIRFLVKDRNILAVGQETFDTDPGILVSAERYPAQNYLMAQDRYQVDLLANLQLVPAAGALCVISFPKPAGGTSFPARVFAIIP